MASDSICDMLTNLVLNKEHMIELDGGVKKMLSVEIVRKFATFHKKLQSNQTTIPAGVSTAKDAQVTLLRNSLAIIMRKLGVNRILVLHNPQGQSTFQMSHLAVKHTFVVLVLWHAGIQTLQFIQKCI